MRWRCRICGSEKHRVRQFCRLCSAVKKRIAARENLRTIDRYNGRGGVGRIRKTRVPDSMCWMWLDLVNIQGELCGPASGAPLDFLMRVDSFRRGAL